MPLLLVLAVVVEHCRIQIPMDLAYIFFCTLLPTDCSITHPGMKENAVKNAHESVDDGNAPEHGK